MPLTEKTTRPAKNRSIICTVSAPTNDRVSRRELPPRPIISTWGTLAPPTIVITGNELVSSVIGIPLSTISRTM